MLDTIGFELDGDAFVEGRNILFGGFEAPQLHRQQEAVLFLHPPVERQDQIAQKHLWSLQGAGGVWFCGAHFGAGFHEDGLQSGLAVAEQFGGVRHGGSRASRRAS